MARPAIRMPHPAPITLDHFVRPLVRPLAAFRPQHVLVPGLAMLLGLAALLPGGMQWSQTRALVLAFAGLGCVAWRCAMPLRAALVAFVLLATGLFAAAIHGGSVLLLREPLAALLIAAFSYTIVSAVVSTGGRDRLLELMAGLGVVVAASGLVGLALNAPEFIAAAGPLRRAAATLADPTLAGILCALTLPAALLLRERRARTGMCAAAVILAGLLATLSAPAIVAAVVGLFFMRAFGASHGVAGVGRVATAAIVMLAGLIPAIAGRPRIEAAAAGLLIGIAIALRSPNPWKARRAVRSAAIIVAVAAIVGGIAATPPPARALASIGVTAAQVPSLSASLSAATDDLRAAGSAALLGAGPGALSAGDTPVSGSGLLDLRSGAVVAYAESGAVGAGFALLALALLALAAWRLRPSAPAQVAVRAFGQSNMVLHVFDSRQPPHLRTLWATSSAVCVSFGVAFATTLAWRSPAIVVLASSWIALAITARAGHSEVKSP